MEKPNLVARLQVSLRDEFIVALTLQSETQEADHFACGWALVAVSTSASTVMRAIVELAL